MTGAFMAQRPCMASSVIHDNTNWWVEYDAWAGIGVSLKDVQPTIH